MENAADPAPPAARSSTNTAKLGANPAAPEVSATTSSPATSTVRSP